MTPGYVCMQMDLYTISVKNGRAGVHIEYPNNGTDKICIPAGQCCSNYDAEVRAAIAATEKSVRLQH